MSTLATALRHLVADTYITLLVGPPNAGCTTRGRITGQAVRHADKEGELIAPLVFFETSDLIAEHIAHNTEYGRIFAGNKEHQNKGGMQPDDAMMHVLIQKFLQLYQEGIRHFVIRGYPRTPGQGNEMKSLIHIGAAVKVVEFVRTFEQCNRNRLHPERIALNRQDDKNLPGRIKTYEEETLPPIRNLETLIDENRLPGEKHYIIVRPDQYGADIGHDMLNIINSGLFVGSTIKRQMIENLNNRFHPAGKLFLPKQEEDDAYRTQIKAASGSSAFSQKVLV